MATYERFIAKVNVTDDCWIWTAGRTGSGYGAFRYDGGTVAHRFSYEAHVGPIPDGHVIDHLCRNKACVNPAHLEAVTQSENISRAPGLGEFQRAKSHCRNGHPYEGDNLYVYPSGQRGCRTCNRESHQRRRAA